MYIEAIQSEVDALAHQLQRSVLVNDPVVRNLYRSVHFGDEDPLRIHAILQRDAGTAVIGHILAQGILSWTRPGQIPPDESLGMVRPRVCAPIRWQGEMIGMIMLVGWVDSFTEDDLRAINQTADLIAPLLAPKLDEPIDQRTVLDLISRDAALRSHALASLPQDQDKPIDEFELQSTQFEKQHVTVVHVSARAVQPVSGNETVGTAHIRAALQEAVTTNFSLRLTEQRYALLGDTAAVLLVSPSSIEREPLKTEISRVLTRIENQSGGYFKAVSGIGSSVVGLERAHESNHQAEVALKATRRSLSEHPKGENFVFWEDLGALGLLLRLSDEELTYSALPYEMQQVLEFVPVPELVQTLQVYLDHGGNAPTTSEALHIHRTTLYYRLSRISKLTGLDLANSHTRLTLHLGLTMWKMLNGTS